MMAAATTVGRSQARRESDPIRRTADGECSGESRIENGEVHPPVKEGGPFSDEKANVGVRATRLRHRCKKTAEADSSGKRHQCHSDPDRAEEHGRTERLRHRCRREKDAERDRFSGNHAGRRNDSDLPLERRHQNVSRAANWKARGPPDPKTPPAVLTGLPNADEWVGSL